MGQSTNAVLFYGFEIGEELPNDMDYHDANEAWEKSHAPPEPEDKSNYHTAEWDEWRKRLGDWRKNGDGVEISSHCSIDYPIYYVTLIAHEHTTYRGYKTEVTPEMLAAVRDDQRAALKEFCEQFGIPHQEPRWWLVSYWG